MSPKKVRLLQHRKQMEEAKQLKAKRQRAKRLGVTLSPSGEYVAPKMSKEFVDYKPSTTYRRETAHIPSLDTGAHVVDKKESMRYTGSLVKGIATMHKSNAVPVINQEEATAISNMRRN